MTDTLRVVSLLSANARPMYAAVVEYLAERVGVPVVFFDAPWAEQAHMLNGGAADLAFMCGLLYSGKTAALVPLAAPVMADQRYGDQAVYFSDIVVRADSPHRTFGNLRGAALAFNDPGSFSGYDVLRAHLAALGEPRGYFGRVVESGAHLRSLDLVLAGEVDAASIDSTVFDLEKARRPELGEQVRVVVELGPNTMPPLVAARHLPDALRQQIHHMVLHMHENEEGRVALAGGLVRRFDPVDDGDYNQIRQIAAAAAPVRLGRNEQEGGKSVVRGWMSRLS